MNDTDLERQLTECLHRHADPVTTSTGMAGRVDRCSRQLRHRRHAAATLSIAPVTAGVAVGAVALAHAHSASDPAAHRVELRPLATTTASSDPSPQPVIDLRGLVDVCAAGTVPHLDVTDQPAPGHAIKPSTIADGQPEIYRLITADHLTAGQVVLTKDGKQVGGDAILVAANLKDGTTQRSWFVAVFPDNSTETVNQALTGPVELAKFEGCVAPSSS